ncbi:MAG TPA: flagellar protein FlgN [Burkholderiales bacterium]|nr:flagellar protein FlgN [Burkholderiales bacterium]
MMRAQNRRSDGAGHFARAAAEELVAMQSFVALLEQERSALGAGKADSLTALTVEKTGLMDILSRCAEQRARLLGEACVPNSAAGVRYLIEADPDAQQIWTNLLEVARRAEELNSGNSYLVNQQLARVDRAMGVIGASRNGFYSTDGFASEQRAPASRSLAQG